MPPTLDQHAAASGISPPAPLAWLTIGLVLVAETLMASGSAVAALVLYGLCLLALLSRAVLAWGDSRHFLLAALALIPVIRIAGLGLVGTRLSFGILAGASALLWLAAALLCAGALRFTRGDLGLAWQAWKAQVVLVLGSVLLGYVQYHIFRSAWWPDASVSAVALSSPKIVPILLLAVNGIVEEFVLRGVVQQAAIRSLSGWPLLYVAFLSAGLQAGSRSAPQIGFAFIVALLFGWHVRRTGSIAGAALAHAVINIVALAVLPAIA